MTWEWCWNQTDLNSNPCSAHTQAVWSWLRELVSLSLRFHVGNTEMMPTSQNTGQHSVRYLCIAIVGLNWFSPYGVQRGNSCSKLSILLSNEAIAAPNSLSFWWVNEDSISKCKFTKLQTDLAMLFLQMYPTHRLANVLTLLKSLPTVLVTAKWRTLINK